MKIQNKRLLALTIAMMSYGEVELCYAAMGDGYLELSDKDSKIFDDIASAFGLDNADLELAAKGAARTNTSVGSSSTMDQLITPENIKTMPLGASLWTSESLFARRSIFDMGILRGRALIPNLEGQQEQGMTSSVSSRSDKKNTSSRFNLDVGAAVRYGGFQGAVGYKHEQMRDVTQMGGRSTASIYSYVTNTLRIEPNAGKKYLELRGALSGVDLVAKQEDAGKSKEALDKKISEYILVEEAGTGDNNDFKYKRVKVVKVYDGEDTLSPRAHIQALIEFERIFVDLKNQYRLFSANETVKRLTLLDMQQLKSAINASIKKFYENYGDSFAIKVSGYSEVEGEAEFEQDSKQESFEKNNAGTLTAGYNSFIGGAEASLSIGEWTKDAAASGASRLTTRVFKRPGDATVDISGYGDKLTTWINNAIKGTNDNAVIPAIAIKPSYPTPPTPRSWKDDPFAPPDMKEFKDFDAWKESRELFKDSKAYRIPDWLKQAKGGGGNGNDDQQGDGILNGRLNINIQENYFDANVARQNVAEQVAANDRRSTEVRRVSGSIVDQVVAAGDGEVQQALSITLSTKSPKKSGDSNLYGDALYKKFDHEFKALKAYGKKVLAREKRIRKRESIFANQVNQGSSNVIKNAVSVADAASTENGQINLDKMMVSSFEAIPYTAVLSALRPDLELPVSDGPDGEVDAFFNTTVLLATLNRYQSLDTYINFIKSIPESGLGNTSIPKNFSDFVNAFEQQIIQRVELSMTTGHDVSDADLASLLNNNIVGLSKDGKSTNVQATILFKKLGTLNAYNYIIELAENSAYFSIIGQAPGGYLPLSFMMNSDPGFGPSNWNNGWCVPQISSIEKLPGIQAPNGYQVQYLKASKCTTVTSETDLKQLLKAKQTPIYPLFIYRTAQKPLLNFVQFIGGNRLIIGRDVSFSPPIGDVTVIPRIQTNKASASAKAALGYDDGMLGDSFKLNQQIAEEFKDERLKQPATFNAFLPSDMSWKYSLSFNKDNQSSYEGYEKNKILITRVGMYAALQENKLSNVNPAVPRFYARGAECISSVSSPNYCPVPTYHLLQPFSYQFKIHPINRGDETSFGLDRISGGNRVTTLIGSNGETNASGDAVLFEQTLYEIGNSPGTKNTGGILALYPISTDLIDGLGVEVFAYSSGSSPKDIFNMGKDGESPFDIGFTKSLLEDSKSKMPN